MSTVAIQTDVEAIRIVSLPREMKDEFDVSEHVSALLDVVQLNVKISHMTTSTGLKYRTAYVEIGRWEDSERANNYKERLLTTGLTLTEMPNTITGAKHPLNYHFDNGGVMNHIKIVAAKKQYSPEQKTLSTEPLILSENEWSSLYIPFLPNDLSMDNGDMRYNDQASLAEFFEDQLKIGQIKSIEFMNKESIGSSNVIRSAIVVFDHWYDNPAAKNLRDTISNKEQFICNGYYDGYEFCPFERKRFIILKRYFVQDVPPLSEKDTRDDLVEQLRAEIANLKDRKAKQLTLKEAWIQLLEVYAEKDIAEQKLIEKYGTDKKQWRTTVHLAPPNG